MWKPAERIKYPPAPGRWPSAEEAASSRLFSPVRLGPIELEQRTWVPAMVPWRATEDGFVTDDVLDWYERFARGRPGGIVIEATGIRDIPSGPLLRIGHDRFIPGLRELADLVRKASGGHSKLFIQLIDFLTIRRRPDPEKYFGRFLRITESHRAALGAEDWPEEKVRGHLAGLDDAELDAILDERELESLRMGYRERVTDTELPHIRDLPEMLPGLFAAAAARAKAAGIDGVELHYAHAYTMASFLSARNDRDDGYGGEKENRVRLPLEVFARVRQEVGDAYPVGCRFLADECIDGGSGVDDACYFGVEFARAGMDFLSLSRGGKFEDAKQPNVAEAAYPYTGRSGLRVHARLYLRRDRPRSAATSRPPPEYERPSATPGFETPIVVTGGVHGFERAEAMLANDQADVVGAARQSLADPDWFLKPGWATARRCGCASTPTIARGWTRSTSR